MFVGSRYILDVYARALDRYRPQPYSARVILFKGKDRHYDSQSDWEKVLIGDCEEHLVNASHEQIREGPYVHLWAETLKDALSRAQQEMCALASATLGVTAPDAVAGAPKPMNVSDFSEMG